MFRKIPNGTRVVLKDAHGVDVPCWIPPIGFGRNSATGQIERTDIIKRSNTKGEQYWEREDLPDWYEKKRLEEEVRQTHDEEYVDAECEKVREKHWRRRLCGVWFYNNGILTYITGLHWFVLNWWKFQGKYFDYRTTNRDFFYFWQYCVEDPNSLGDIEITKRKDGKTARAGAILYEPISRNEAKHGGIQSKTDKDAAEVFQKAVSQPWQKLPHFFRPLYDTTGGDAPKKEMRFFNPSRKGRKKNVPNDPALESYIDFKAALESAYDGPELFIYVSDEAGKLEKVDILKRHGVVRFCSEVDGRFIGKQHYTTTVEEMESGGSSFRELVKMSDRRQLDKNGRTASGLYCWFLPAYKTLFYDKYGDADEVKAREYYQNTRDSLRNRPHELSSFIRKNPFTLDECFRIDGDKCLYNSELLNDRLELLSSDNAFTERVSLSWEGGVRDSKVIVTPNKNGRWERCKVLTPEESNQVIKRGTEYHPNNTLKFVGGADPFDHSVVRDKRRSDGCGMFKQKYSSTDQNDPYNDAFILRYRFRPEAASIFYEDMVMSCFLLGCEILIENNKIGCIRYFESRGYRRFLIVLNPNGEPGVAGSEKTLQEGVETTEEYINRCINKVFFRTLVAEWLEFDITHTTLYDEAMATLYCLIADKYRTGKKGKNVLTDITEYFRMNKVV